MQTDNSYFSDLGEHQDCPQCGMIMHGIAGAKNAVCQNCGYKETCC